MTLPMAPTPPVMGGALVPNGAALALHVRLDRKKLATFEVDAVVVAEAGPPAEPTLFGLPRVFQRLYTRERRRELALYTSSADSLLRRPRSLLERVFAVFGVNTAAAAAPVHVDIDTITSSLAAAGADLFLNETFDGNGRTCATCHVEANNFTVDPAFIASLPSSDPLFVSETNPALATLENADLLRRFGLILVNADGFDPSRGFVFRGAQNVQALANVETVLKHAGFELRDIVRLTYYTTDVDEFSKTAREGVGRILAAGCKPASTLLGVSRLFHPDILVEIEATAMK